MNKRSGDYEALAALAASEREGRSHKRDLLKKLEDELHKDEDALDPVLAGKLVDSLYETDGLSPPQVTGQEVEACIARIKKEEPGSRRTPPLGRFLFAGKVRRPVRWAAAFCGVLLFVFSANYVTALVSGACLVSRIEPRLCSETKYCPCDRELMEKTPH
ncbi:MAG: hypothetical protein LBQ88_01870 [Treponema sp.]|jgi:hypothetical protein|nr:hypothetical protein [Treponema sp.]